MSKIIQIASAEARYFNKVNGMHEKHITLFALDDSGRIWTRYYDGEAYREWFPLATTGLPKEATES